MAQPPHADPRHRPTVRVSDRGAPPEVTDPLLWALAVDVAAAHQPGPDGACTNLQCRGQHGACWALRTAHRAAQHPRQVTRRPPAPVPPPEAHPIATQPAANPPHRGGTTRGRVTAPATTPRFAGWFGPTAPTAAPTPAPPTATPAAQPAPEPVAHQPILFRRPPMAALVA